MSAQSHKIFVTVGFARRRCCGVAKQRRVADLSDLIDSDGRFEGRT